MFNRGTANQGTVSLTLHGVYDRCSAMSKLAGEVDQFVVGQIAWLVEQYRCVPIDDGKAIVLDPQESDSSRHCLFFRICFCAIPTS